MSIKEHFKNLIPNIRNFFIKRRVLKKLISHYEEELETNKLMEKWVIKKILEGQLDRRKELADKQALIKDMERYLEFFKNTLKGKE